MIKRFHLQLTAFFIAVIAIVLAALTTINLLTSEKQTWNNDYVSFLNDLNAIYSNLETQNVISYEWLFRMQNNDSYIIYIEDNTVPLLFDQLVGSEERTNLIKTAKERAVTEHSFDIERSTNKILTTTVEFDYTDEKNNLYYISAAIIPKTNGQLGVLVIHPTARIRQQMMMQRILFISLDFLALVILAIFCYFFTKKLLKPIEESRQRQIQFVASTSHELRSPLTVILSSLSAFRKAGDEDEQQKEKFLASIDSEANRMSRLIEDMLLLARADSKTWSLYYENVEFDTLVMDLYEKFEPLAMQKKIQLDIQLPDDELSPVLCDKIRMEQIVTILLDNAISYTPENGHIMIKLKDLGSQIQISVSDTGPGVAENEKKAIFERFYRSDQSRTDRKHAGLGLSIAKEIVRLHKGRIWVEDNTTQGSVFKFIIPYES